nr:phage capsid protein [uncultured Mediterranean phage uvMED]
MGLAFQNLGTTPNESVFTKDVASATKLVTSGSFSTDLQQEIYERSALIQSGLLAQDARLNNIQGVICEMPFAAPLNYEEEAVNSSDTWGKNGLGYYTLQKTQTSTQYAPMVSRGAAFAADDLSVVQTGFDALANIRSQLATDMNRKITAKILAQIEGIFSGPLVNHEIAPVAGNEELSSSDLIKARALLGERGDDMDILIVHPDVKYHLQDLGMTVLEGAPGTTISYATGGIGVTSTELGYFAGFRVISDSQVGKDGDYYNCYVMKSGMIRTGQQFATQIETERNILSLQNTMTCTYNRIDHIIGTSWVAGAYASDPLNDDLAEGSNWIAAYKDTRLIPMVKIKVKNPKFQSLEIAPDDRFEKHPSVIQKGDKSVPKEAAAGKDGQGLGGTEFPKPTP